MSYDMQAAIDLLGGFWDGSEVNGIIMPGDTSYEDIVDITKMVVYQAALYPEYKLVYASQGVFTNALTLEPQRESTIAGIIAQHSDGGFFSPLFSPDYYKAAPRWYMLTSLKTAIWGGFINLPDPTGLANWVGLLAPAGAAIAHTIASDPEPLVRAAALDLLKSVNWPVQWVQSILGGLGGLDDAIAASSWDQGTRASLSALSKDVRARALTVANAAQSANFTTITTATGEQAQMPAPPVKPWYRNGIVWSSLALGTLGGVMTAVHRSKQNRR